jgi:autotransporter-associated beta strand protein
MFPSDPRRGRSVPFTILRFPAMSPKHPRLPARLLLSLSGALTAAADVHTWDGQGVFERWNSAINWVGNNLPSPGDDLVWNANGATGYETDNDFPSGTSFRSLTCTSQHVGAGNGWVHDGNLLVLGSGGITLHSALGDPPDLPHATFRMPLRLGSDQTWRLHAFVVLENGATLNLNNHDLEIVATGINVVSFHEPVSGAGSMTIGNGNGGVEARFWRANSFTAAVTVEQDSLIYAADSASLGTAASPTTVRGTLEFNDDMDVSENLIVEGGEVTFNTAISGPEGPTTFRGNMQLSGQSETNLRDGNIVTMTGGMTGTGIHTIRSYAPGPEGESALLRLTGSVPNTFSGTLRVTGEAERLELQLDKTSATAVFGPLEVLNNARVGWLRPSQFGANVSLILEVGGRAEMNGHSDSVKDLHLLGGSLLPEGGVLSVKEDIFVDDSDGVTVVGTLRMQGNAVPHVWNVAFYPTLPVFALNGAVTESSALGTTVVQKTGSGVARWTGDSGIDRLEVLDGSMSYEGNGIGMDVTIDGGNFTGEGTLRDVLARSDGGSLHVMRMAGEGPLAVRNLTLNAGSGLATGITPIPQAHLTASGTVILNGAALGLPILGDLIGIGDQITIIRKDSAGPVSGTFAGRPEGSLHSFSRGAGDPLRTYRISYLGGDGNDVTLTLVSVAPSGLTKTWTGLAAVPELSNPQNWNPQSTPQPGDALVFPDVIRKNLNQDLGAYFPLASIRFTSDGYHLIGQPLGVQQHVTGDFASGVVQVNAPLRLAGNVTFSAPNTGRLRFGTVDVFSLDLAGFDLTFHSTAVINPLSNSPPTLQLGDTAAAFQPFTGITGAGSLRKTGAGFAAIACFCDFTGPVTVVAGRLAALASDALGEGGPGNHTTVNAGAVLDLAAGIGGSTSFPDDFFVSGTVRPIVFDEGGAAALIGGVFTVAGTAVVDAAESTSNLYLRGVVTGGTLRKTGPGNLMIGNPVLVDPPNAFPNTFSRLEIEAGRVFLAKEAGIVAASVVNASGGTLRLHRPDQIGDRLSVSGTAVADLFGNVETLNRLDATGGTVSGAAGSGLTVKEITGGGAATAATVSVPVTLSAASGGAATLNVVDGTPADDLIFTAAVTPEPGVTLSKSGTGLVRFDGPSSASAQIIGGKALYMGGGNAAVLLLGGAVGGTGPVGAISGTGRVEPGASPGILASSSLSWGATTTFAPEILNGTAGTGYDQLDVTGTVTLGSAILETNVLAGAVLPAGTVLTVIKNDGTDAVTGTFAGLPNNAVFSAGGKTFRVHYDGPLGTGNDVTLTLVSLGTGVTRVWDGETSGQWSVATNWVNLPGNPPSAPAAGDDLVFPAGAANQSMTNNFAAGTVFNSITVQASGYTLGGSNAVLLNAGINFEQPSGLTTIHLPVTLTQAQAFTVTAAGTPQFSGAGAITNNGFPLTLQIAGGGLLLTGFTGAGGLVKTGPGNLAFGTGNSFTGPVTISSGTASIAAAVAGAGAGTAAITISPGATLNFSSTTGTLAKPVTLGGRLSFSNTSVTLSGAITLPSGNDGILEPLLTSTPVLSGIISGPGRLEKRQSGTVVLSGTAANTFTGGTTVTEGTLRLQKSAGLNAVPGTLNIGDGAGTDTVTLLAANQIGNSATVTIHGGALQCGTFNEQIASLRMTGGSVTGSGVLTVGGISSFAAAAPARVDVNLNPGEVRHDISAEDGTAAVDLQINGEWNGAVTLDVTKLGEGTVVFSGNGVANTLQLDGGLTRIHRDWNGVAIRLNGGALGGTGPVGAVESMAEGGGIAPGASPDVLTTGSVTGSEKTVMSFELGGAAPGSGYDQLAVTGAFNPVDATLEIALLPGFFPLAGQSFVLVANDGADSIATEFRNAPAEQEIDFGSFAGAMNYRGGDGNDAALLIVRINDTRMLKRWDGGGANNKWTTAANWEDDIGPAPGDSLQFPAGAAQLTAQNDFPAGTNFHQVLVGGAGYTLTGARLALNAGIEANFGAGFLDWSLPLVLTRAQTVRHTGTGNFSFSPAGTIDTNGHVLTVETSPGPIFASGVISGGGGLQKTGGGELTLDAANTFTGSTAINQGSVNAYRNTSLGGSAVVQAAGSLSLTGTAGVIVPSALTLRGTVFSGHALHRINGTITVPAGATPRIEVGNSHRLDLAGRIQSSGSLRKAGGGTLGLIGTLSNTFTGGLNVLDGEVIAGKTAGVVALPGPVNIGDGTPGTRRVTLAAANQIADAATVRLNGDGAELALGGFAETLTALEMVGGTVNSGPGTLTLTGTLTTLPAETTALVTGSLALGGTGLRDWTVADGAVETDLELAAFLSAPGGAVLRKLGDGSMAVSGAGSGIMRLQADAGRVRFTGNQPLLDLDLNGATLDGTGTLGTLASLNGGGIIAPGFSPGELTLDNIITNAATTLRFEINGTVPGTDYDRLVTSEPGALGNAVLDVQLGFTPAVGDSFLLIENTNPLATLSDTFAGLPQFGHFAEPGEIVFLVNYTGGDGNDLVITRVEVPAPEITGWSAAPGTGPNAGSIVVDVQATGTPGLTYDIESSADMVTWTVVATETAAAGTGALAFQVIEPATVQRTFHRARLP